MRLTLSAAQWFLFILTGSLVAPVVVASAFHLSPADTVGLLQRTLLVIGVSSLLQALLGHKLPILEGPAGIWWGVFVLLAAQLGAGGAAGLSLLQSLEAGLILSGVLLMLLSALRLIQAIKRLFTPAVTGTYLVLLIIQFSSSIIKGMFGIDYLGPHLHWKVLLASALTLAFSIYCGRSRYKALNNYTVLYGVVFGYTLFRLLGLHKASAWSDAPLAAWPQLLAWGRPELDGGIVLTALVIALLLTINLVASVVVVENAVGRSPQPVYNRSGFIMGVNHVLSGLFAAIGCVANSHTAGYIAATRMSARLPFGIACGVIIALSFFPSFTALLATIPAPVALAVIFYPFTHLLAAGLRDYAKVLHEERQLLVVTVAFIVGAGSLFVPASALSELPAVWRSLLNNGVVLGVLTAIGMEQGLALRDKLTRLKTDKAVQTVTDQRAL